MSPQQIKPPTKLFTRTPLLQILIGSAVVMACINAAVAQTESTAQLRLASLFADGMVLQRQQTVPVWGWTEPNARVEVSFAQQTVTGQADAEGKFFICLAELEASDQPRKLVVQSAGATIEANDVLVGEVWLCSGQSNMQHTVKQSLNANKEIAEANYPLIRLFKTDFDTSLTPLDTCAGAWRTSSPENVPEYSAAAYYFGRALHRELNVPIGLINSSVGATCVEAWSPPESLKRFPLAVAHQAGMDARAGTFQQDKVDARFEQQMKMWREKTAAAKAAGKNDTVRKGKTKRKAKLKRPVKEAHPHESKNYPGNLYHAMIHPLVSYGIRGVIWYQGERNAKTIKGAKLYRELLENLTLRWRADWNAELPFYAVQLVNFRKPVARPVDDTPWAFIRESFLRFQNEVPGTGIAVGIDVGEAQDIHPKNKQAIGERLARQALAKTYGQSVVADGPLFKSFQLDGDKIVIQFDSVGTGLMAKDDDTLKTFAIAGANRKFVSATAEIVGETVVVSAPTIKNPVAVRYAWADNPQGCNLFNKEGLPASPFRTDSWETPAKK